MKQWNSLQYWEQIFLEKERFVLIKESKLRLENKVSKDESKQNMKELLRLLYDKEEKLANKKNVTTSCT